MKSIITFVLLFSFIHFGGATNYNSGFKGLSGNAKVSWYGSDWHGKKTANGEIYDMNSMTAAHKKLPFGTKVKITNTRNDKSVIVRINNRGPYIKGREFDLSRAAFSEIADLNTGVLNIEYEILN